MATLIALLFIIGAVAYGIALISLAAAPRIARLIGLLGIVGAVAYGVAWISLAAAQGSRNTEAYLWLGLMTLPLVVVGAAGYARMPAQPRWGGALMLFGGALLTAWGFFIWIDVGPGWFLSGLAVLAGGFASLKRPVRRTH